MPGGTGSGAWRVFYELDEGERMLIIAAVHRGSVY